MRLAIHAAGRRLIASLCLLCLTPLAAHSAPQIKVLLCTGDYGMWAQDRAARITAAVEKAAPGRAAFTVEQTYNFVKKLEAPGYAGQFDVIACGDVALGQMTVGAQDAIVRFVENGGGFVYVVEGKSGIGVNGPPEADPVPLAAILPYRFPATDPEKDARADAVPVKYTDPFLKGLDFAGITTLPKNWQTTAPLFLERKQGKGRVIALYGAFCAPYRYVSYARFDHLPGGWDEWPGLGELWARLLSRAGASSPIAQLSRAEADAAITDKPLTVTVAVDATKSIDDIRAASFSIVSLGQLYREDGGANEAMFLALNPRDWLDRASDQVFENTAGKAFPDKAKLFDTYHLQGILHADNTFGSYGGWNEEKWQQEIARLKGVYERHAKQLRYFQPANEPPCDEGYFKFHNRIAAAMIQAAPELKVIGPSCAFNMSAPGAQAMKAFIDTCGARTDVLNWHIYACPPENVKREVEYWSRYATGKLRTPGPARVMFTEADAWNTRESQFNYLMERAFTFLPCKEIVATFQYCMDPRTEGGTYRFGVLQPEKDAEGRQNEFRANYNGYWIFRNLRGKMVETTVTSPAGAAAGHIHVISSNTDGGKAVTTVVYYDTGYFDGPAKARSSRADVAVTVTLPAGTYRLERSEATWGTSAVVPVAGTVTKSAKVSLTLAPCQAAALTWVRQE